MTASADTPRGGGERPLAASPDRHGARPSVKAKRVGFSEAGPIVAQASVRLSEGGAAGVARNLASGLGEVGRHSAFIYGYSTRGKSSPLERDFKGVQLASAAGAKARQLTHGVLGAEFPGLTVAQRVKVERALADTQVVHFHALHSYWTDPFELWRYVRSLDVGVVWTMHDHWLFTGRCAQPGACDRWRSGCGSCPNLAAYPPARLDRSSTVWAARRRLLSELMDDPGTEVVSCANWLAEAVSAAGLAEIRSVPNAIDPALHASLQSVTAGPEAGQERSGSIFMCRDLRDDAKVNWAVLRELDRGLAGRLTVVGDNAPEPLSSATMRPAITDRRELARVLRSHRRLVFTSTVDYHPLTVIEALCAGLEVYAVSSPAASDLSSMPGMTVFPSADELAAELIQNDSHVPDHAAIARHALELYAPTTMRSHYDAVYEEVIDRL